MVADDTVAEADDGDGVAPAAETTQEDEEPDVGEGAAAVAVADESTEVTQ